MFWLLACTGAPAEPPPVVGEVVDPCPAAWEEMAATRAAMSTLTPDARGPDEQAFLDACHRLPEDARPCMSMARLIDDPACPARLDAVPREVRDAVAEALTVDGNQPPH